MNRARQISLSAAVFVLICFFLPWLQVSCMGVRDSASGFDLARDGSTSLWLVPILMGIVLLAGLLIWQRKPALMAFVGIVGGGFSAYLMYHKHFRTGSPNSLVAAQWTVWFWLGLASAIVVAVSAFFFYLGRSRSP